MQLLRSPKTIDQLPIKGTLMNLALEKRNAQLICGADGKGLDTILEMAFRQKDPMLMKLARNLATHEGSIQQHFEVCLFYGNCKRFLGRCRKSIFWF